MFSRLNTSILNFTPVLKSCQRECVELAQSRRVFSLASDQYYACIRRTGFLVLKNGSSIALSRLSSPIFIIDQGFQQNAYPIASCHRFPSEKGSKGHLHTRICGHNLRKLVLRICRKIAQPNKQIFIFCSFGKTRKSSDRVSVATTRTLISTLSRG